MGGSKPDTSLRQNKMTDLELSHWIVRFGGNRKQVAATNFISAIGSGFFVLENKDNNFAVQKNHN